MHMTFWMMILLVLSVVALFVLLAVSRVFAGKKLLVVRALLLLIDVTTVVALMKGPEVLRYAHGHEDMIVILLRAAAIVFMGQMFLLLLVLLGSVWQRLAGLGKSSVPFDPSRRKLLRHATMYPALAAVGSLYGGLYEKDALAIREFDVPVKGLPEALQGLRIAQISDIHLGWFFSLEKLQDLLERAAQGAPDALVITGDLFDNDGMNVPAVGIVDRFVPRFPQGIWFVYGNHEHMRNFKQIDDALNASHIHKLVNAAAPMAAGAPLYFVGVDYPFSHEEAVFQANKRNMANQAFFKVPEGATTIFLAHHPEDIDDGAAHGAALTLTGHTHGCQFGLFGKSLLPVFKYNRGIVHLGDSTGYVHSGNGSWFPFRFGCPPEIAYFTLQRA